MNDIKIGDIILVSGFSSQGKEISRHSFVVIEDQNGEVCSLNYDFIALLMSSIKSEKQKEKKLSFPGNFFISPAAEDVKNGHGREGYIKAEQFYYFKKDKIDYQIIGELKEDTLNALFDFIGELPRKAIAIERITDNL